jgi:hypothetical protein
MAYYTALISAWNNATQPPTGVQGTALTGLTTANKIIAVNNWTVTGTIPTSFFVSGAQLLNCINWTEFAALTAQQQSNLLTMCACNSSPLAGGTGNVSLLAPGMFLAYFTNHSGPTITSLSALAASQIQPWWSTSVANGGGGLSGPVSQVDVTIAGLS